MTRPETHPATPIAMLRQFDAICDRFEQAWHSGGSPHIDDYVSDLHDSPFRPELLRQLLEVEFEQRMRRGRLDPRDYETRYPELGRWLADRVVQLSSAASGEAVHSNTDRESRTDGDEQIAVGHAFGKYHVLEKIGTGGMGAVYRVQHSMIDCIRALKLLRPNLARHPEAIQRFLSEAQTSIELVHPHIVTTYDVDQTSDGTIYIVMELVEGENLYELVSRRGPLPFSEAAEIIRQVAGGLDAAHRRGTVHRDIKPHNIMWNSSGVAKILDLGLARILDNDTAVDLPELDESHRAEAMVSRFQSRLTHRQALVGTLPYMSPEQAADAHGAGPQSDLYSLGCTFYYLLAAKHAFVGETVEEIVERHVRGDFTPLDEHRPDLPPALSRIVAKLMHRQSEDRFVSAATVADALTEWIERGTEARPAPTIDLDDPSSLRDSLVELQLISKDQWRAATESAADQSTPGVAPSSTSMRVLKQLTALESEGDRTALSDFQLHHILSGNPDLVRLPHHVLLDQVGSGWKGEVYRARNLDLDRLEVARTFAPRALEGLVGHGRQRIAEFHKAIDRLRDVEHPGLPQVFESGRFDSRLYGELAYYASEFVEGDTLAAIVRQPQRRTSDPLWCATVVRDLCRVLEHAHRAGVLHLDVHPLNVKVMENDQVRLLDLGVAEMVTRRRQEAIVAPMMRAVRSTAQRYGGTWSAPADSLHASEMRTVPEPPPVGTMHVMPPEQWQNRSHVSAATDIYNVGCTLFFLTAGQYPFDGSGALELMEQHLNQSPLKCEAAGRIPAGMHPIIEKAMAKKPNDRFKSCGEMADALDALSARPDLMSAPKGDPGFRSFLKRLLRP